MESTTTSPTTTPTFSMPSATQLQRDEEMLLAMAEEIQPTKDTATTMVAWLAPPFKELQNRVIHMAYDYQKTINNKQLLVDNKTKGKHLKSSQMQTCTHTRNTEGILPKAFNFSKPPSTYVWGIEDKDRNARDDAIDATLLLVKIHWEEWTVFGESACDETVRQKGLDNTVVEHITYEVPQLFK